MKKYFLAVLMLAAKLNEAETDPVKHKRNKLSKIFFLQEV